MDIRTSEPRKEPPPIRPWRVDWHALDEESQADVIAYQSGGFELAELSMRAQVYLRRHFGAV